MTWRRHLLALLECSEGVSGPTSYTVRMLCSLVFQSVVEGVDSFTLTRDGVAGWRVTPTKAGRTLPGLAIRIPDVAVLDRTRAQLPAAAFVLAERPADQAAAIALATPPDDVVRDLAEYEKLRAAWFDRPESPRHLGPSSETLLGFARATFVRPEVVSAAAQPCVLIVDDEADWRQDLSDEVKAVAPTAHCIAVGSAAEARAVWQREQHIDLGIVDQRIPEQPGGDVDAVHGRVLLDWARTRGHGVVGTTAADTDADFYPKSEIRPALRSRLRAA